MLCATMLAKWEMLTHFSCFGLVEHTSNWSKYARMEWLNAYFCSRILWYPLRSLLQSLFESSVQLGRLSLETSNTNCITSSSESFRICFFNTSCKYYNHRKHETGFLQKGKNLTVVAKIGIMHRKSNESKKPRNWME
jgi:hypothetical protein